MADFLKILASRYRFLSLPEKQLICDVSGSADVLAGMKKADIEAVTGRKHRIGAYTLENIVKDAENAKKLLAAEGIKCLFFDEKEYPAQLAEIYNPPFALYYKGELPDWNTPAAAVVGTRLATGAGIDAAYSLGFELGRSGIPVVSGLALGIDSAAHSGCVAAGGVTIAVLGGGADRVYPQSNRKIAAGILAAGGALISEYLPGEVPQKQNFPERNRIISGLSRATVVVEAPGKSGALITADFALEQGRDLYVHKAAKRGSCENERLEKLLFDGAPMIECAEDIFSDWGLSIKGKIPSAAEKEILTSGMAGAVLAEQLEYELDGNNIKFNGNYFRRACYESSYSIDS